MFAAMSASDAVQDILLRLAEVEGPLRFQSHLETTLRDDDIVRSLASRKKHLQLSLIDACCEAAVGVTQRNKPSWSAECLFTLPQDEHVQEALKFVKLAEMTLLSPSVVSHNEALRSKCYSVLEERGVNHDTTGGFHGGIECSGPLSSSQQYARADDIGGAAVQREVRMRRLRFVWRSARVHHVAAAVHRARGEKKIGLALEYSQKAFHLLKWVVAGSEEDTYGGGVSSSTSIMPLLQAALDVGQRHWDRSRSKNRHQQDSFRGEDGSAKEDTPTAIAELVVSMIASHAVLLLHRQKHAEAFAVAKEALDLAEELVVEIRVRMPSIWNGMGYDCSGLAHSPLRSAEMLVALLQYNLAMIMGCVTAASKTVVAIAESILEKSSPGVQRYLLKRCVATSREMLGDRNSFVTAAQSALFDVTQSARHADRPEMRAIAAGGGVPGLLRTAAARRQLQHADDTLHEFQAMAGLLSQQTAKQQRARKDVNLCCGRDETLHVTRRRDVDVERWAEIPHGYSVLGPS